MRLASATDSQIALLPIKPQYARSIIDGSKKVEFRKSRFRHDVSYVVVYASSPVKRILGYFEVRRIVTAPPKKLWKDYRTVGGIDRGDFEDYYRERDTGVAIEVGEVVAMPSPVRLSRLAKNLSPPQSFCYLPGELFETLRRRTWIEARGL